MPEEEKNNSEEPKLEFLRVRRGSQENSAMVDGREDISESNMGETEGGGLDLWEKLDVLVEWGMAGALL